MEEYQKAQSKHICSIHLIWDEDYSQWENTTSSINGARNLQNIKLDPCITPFIKITQSS